MTRAITVFTDLDDTLFQTQTKAQALAGRTGDGAAVLTEAAYDRCGAPLSFHTPAQLALLDLLQGCEIIPVTGRNRIALDRVVSPVFHACRITSHGAVLYGPDGEVLPSWRDPLATGARAFGPAMQDLCAAVLDLIERARLAARVRIIEDAGVPVYVSIKGEQPDLDQAEQLVREQGGERWRLHRNGRNLAALPPFADKRAAVAHLMAIKRAQDPTRTFLGLGDSVSDLGFMTLCDFALVPSGTQIHQACWS
jgi:hydroxymethylpyrimidine pyrophosphatase-like HAD family hydrolase